MKAKDKMSSDPCIGIAARNGAYEVAAVEHGKASAVMKFPANGKGIEAISGLLANYGKHVRLAVAGAAGLSLGLALGKVAGRETFIVSEDVADQAATLARYAEHAV